jgi:hypothetical protein
MHKFDRIYQLHGILRGQQLLSIRARRWPARLGGLARAEVDDVIWKRPVKAGPKGGT